LAPVLIQFAGQRRAEISYLFAANLTIAGVISVTNVEEKAPSLPKGEALLCSKMG
jgi:hypothetical protein